MNQRTLAKKIDRLGEIKAEIAVLNEEADEIRNALIAAEIEEAHGKLFQVKFLTSEREQIAWKDIVIDQQVSEKVIKRFTTATEVTQMRVTARK